MPRWGMVIDLDKCTACQACTVACRSENNVTFQGPEGTAKGRAMFWREVLAEVDGEFPKVTAHFLPRPCMHCDNPPCVQVCPVGATYKREDGVVLQHYEQCIGCRYCMVACPYNARFFNWEKPEFPETMAQYQNPNPKVKPRPVGVVEKCTFCFQRIEKGILPACAQTCTGNATFFGDLDDPDSRVSQLAKSPRAFRLLEDLGTNPKVYYLKEG
ncbi:MAG: 4Fe-4S dicluster domain-containing protein [Chloroflexi bacterium]|nr:4Fe-4S dicluster domain-containing protein [Chloroflexota bacterium]